MAKVNRQILASDGKTMLVPGQDYKLSKEDTDAFKELGVLDDGNERNGAVDGAARMGTRQVIAGEDPNTGARDARDSSGLPTVEVQRSYQPTQPGAEVASPDGEGREAGFTDTPKDVGGAPENKVRTGRARK